MIARRLVSILCGALAAAALAATAAIAAKWDAIERLPGRTPVTLLVQEQPRLYFRVTGEAPLTFPLDGPTRLRIVSRLDLPRGSRQVVSYTLKVSEGGRELARENTESSPSSQVRDPDGKREIGKSRRLGVDVPPGRHVLTLTVAGTPSLLVRLHQAAPARGGAATVSLTPFEAPRTVTVSEGEKMISYYSALPGRPVRLRVVGPTALDLITRLDFDDTMRGTYRYRLAISEGGRRIREVEFKTTKATTAVFTDLADRVPSKLDRVRIPVAKGTHEIAIELLAPPRGSAEIHARIPQPITGTQE